MSSDDYIVDPLRDSEVREHAKTLRRALGWTNVERVDPFELETATEIWTVRGKKPFKLEFVSDVEIPGDAGLTAFDGSKIVVKIPRRIRHKAFLGDGHARFTIGHEIGHAVLHLDKLMKGAVLPRVSPAWIPKFKSAEHQAMVFGAALLINDETARGLASPEDISVQAGVSLTAARIHFEQVQEDLARPAAAPGFSASPMKCERLWRPNCPAGRSHFSTTSAPVVASRSFFLLGTSSCARPARRSTIVFKTGMRCSSFLARD
jgi:hypothetical protein